MTSSETGKAFAVLFEDLIRWDVSYFHQVEWEWADDTLQPIGDALHRVIREVPRTEYRKGLRVIDKITFGGELQSFDLESEDDYKGRLFKVRAGELIYSKIRLKQGSVAQIPKDISELAVSAEYPAYCVNAKVALCDYLLLVLRSRGFQDLLAGISHGGSTKTRLHPRDFEHLIIPLPDLTIQQAIVDYWNESKSTVQKTRENIASSITSLNERLLEFYEKETSKDVIHSRFFAIDFAALAGWDVKAGRASAFRLACPSFRPMGDFIEEATELVRPFDEPEKDWPLYGVNNKEGVFLNSHQKGDTFSSPYKHIRKDWFFHNPTRCNVGSLGIVPEVPIDAITSPEYQVWRIKEDAPDPMLPGFIAVLIQTPFFIDLVQFNRVGGVKQRMYTENLCQLRIPYLPVSEQRKYAKARNKALTELTEAKKRLVQVREDVEAMILGTKPVAV